MIQVSLYNLSPGLILAQDVRCSNSNNLLLKEGSKITETHIELLKANSVMKVWVTEPHTVLVNPQETTMKELKELLLQQISKFAPNHKEANTSDKMVKVSQDAQAIAQVILADPEVVRICTEMKIMDNDLLYQHCVNTCVLSLLVAGAMDLGQRNIQAIGIAALLHDLGLCEMPQLLRIAQKNKQEEKLWQEHAQYGYYFAKEAGIREEICEFILHHHEYWNGSGYPHQLAKAKIPLGARIIAVCESYDSLIRRDKYPQYQAIEYLYGGGGILFDSNIVNAMCNNLAVYPLGSMVRLSTDEVGVVVNVRKNLGPRPIVYIYYNHLNKPYKVPKTIDLGKELTVFIKEIL